MGRSGKGANNVNMHVLVQLNNVNIISKYLRIGEECELLIMDDSKFYNYRTLPQKRPSQISAQPPLLPKSLV